jgi:RecA-family ATPase
VAAVIRTVRALEAETGQRFSMVVIDPLVEFMTGEENGEGMQLATRGLRALARLLDCAVVVGHHTNADGSRERGAAFLRMRAGTVMRLDIPEGSTDLGLVQEKNRFDEKQAIALQMVPSGPGVVLEWTGMALAEDYAAEQKATQSKRKAAEKERRQVEAASAARQRVLGVVRENPGISKTQAFAAAGGNRSEFHAAIDALVREGRLVEGASRDPS